MFLFTFLCPTFTPQSLVMLGFRNLEAPRTVRNCVVVRMARSALPTPVFYIRVFRRRRRCSSGTRERRFFFQML
jgi:hypothetical protein